MKDVLKNTGTDRGEPSQSKTSAYPESGSDTLLKLVNLNAGYQMKQGKIKAVDSINLELKRGEFLGIAGESGCGKSTLAYTIMGLLEDNGRVFDGQLFFDGRKISPTDEKVYRTIRWNKVSMVFQSAMNSLNPVLTIREQLTDALLSHDRNLKAADALERAKSRLRLVDISEDRLDAYPHQLSGGMKQRVMIAMALIMDPDIIIMDEPTTALDVVVQRTIIDKIAELQREFQFAVIFITHDISLLVEISDKLIIMYAGQVVESGPAARVYNYPAHPYTRGLMRSFPSLTGKLIEFGGIPGKPPDFLSLPGGCRFSPRCPEAKDVCRLEDPDFIQVGEDHHGRCHFARRKGERE